MLGRPVAPFLKWAGGKRWLVHNCHEIFPREFNRYFEPFLGSGAVFFYLDPENAILSDRNVELVDVYRALRDDWEKVYDLLSLYSKNHSKEYYYHIRDSIFDCKNERAARFIYLNRTCWNGLFRVNKAGKFNVPKGTKDKIIYETDDFYRVALKLKNANIYDGDFEKIIDLSMDGDLVFADPPYTIKHNNNGFLKYNESLFSWEDQIRLRDSLLRARDRGAKVIVTNAAHESVEELYRDAFQLKKVGRHSILAGNPRHRKACEELIVWG